MLNKNELERLLQEFKTGDTPIERFIELMSDYIQINKRRSRDYIISKHINLEIGIFPEDVKKILSKFIKGELNEDEIRKWASLILALVDVYSTPLKKGEKEDKYEPMWYIIQQLASPEVDGNLTIQKAELFIEELNRIY